MSDRGHLENTEEVFHCWHYDPGGTVGVPIFWNKFLCEFFYLKLHLLIVLCSLVFHSPKDNLLCAKQVAFWQVDKVPTYGNPVFLYFMKASLSRSFLSAVIQSFCAFFKSLQLFFVAEDNPQSWSVLIFHTVDCHHSLFCSPTRNQ